VGALAGSGVRIEGPWGKFASSLDEVSPLMGA